MALLEVENLQAHFRTPEGVNRAVDGVSFNVDEPESSAADAVTILNTEPGSYKSDTALLRHCAYCAALSASLCSSTSVVAGSSCTASTAARCASS